MSMTSIYTISRPDNPEFAVTMAWTDGDNGEDRRTFLTFGPKGQIATNCSDGDSPDILGHLIPRRNGIEIKWISAKPYGPDRFVPADKLHGIKLCPGLTINVELDFSDGVDSETPNEDVDRVPVPAIYEPLGNAANTVISKCANVLSSIKDRESGDGKPVIDFFRAYAVALKNCFNANRIAVVRCDDENKSVEFRYAAGNSGISRDSKTKRLIYYGYIREGNIKSVIAKTINKDTTTITGGWENTLILPWGETKTYIIIGGEPAAPYTIEHQKALARINRYVMAMAVECDEVLMHMDPEAAWNRIAWLNLVDLLGEDDVRETIHRHMNKFAWQNSLASKKGRPSVADSFWIRTGQNVKDSRQSKAAARKNVLGGLEMPMSEQSKESLIGAVHGYSNRRMNDFEAFRNDIFAYLSGVDCAIPPEFLSLRPAVWLRDLMTSSAKG